MNLITTLLITFTLNGSPQSVSLLTTSMESCQSDMYVAGTIVRVMGGTNINMDCVTRNQ
jgi:hypothetical protein